MTKPLFDPKQVQFFRPRPALNELTTLLEIRSHGTLAVDPHAGSGDGEHGDMVAAFLDTLAESGYLDRLDRGAYRVEYRVTATGERRINYLLIDYFQELLRLDGMARQLMRQKLAELYIQGARRVAFYGAGETAEVARAALDGTGLLLAMIVDDDESKWGGQFHSLRIEPSSALSRERIDTVVVTSWAAQQVILGKLGRAKAEGIRLAVFL